MRAGVLGLLTAADRGVARQVPPAQKRPSVNSTSLDVLPDGGTLHLSSRLSGFCSCKTFRILSKQYETEEEEDG